MGGGPRAGVGLLVGTARDKDIWRFQPAHWWVDLCFQVSGCSSLEIPDPTGGQGQFLTGLAVGSSVSQIWCQPHWWVGGAGSWGSWLRDPKCPRAGIGLLVCRARAQGSWGLCLHTGGWG